MSDKKSFKTSIGGQALIEGVMMKGTDKIAMSVRVPNGEIDTECWEIGEKSKSKWYKKTPFVRGIFNFVEMMMLGYKCLSKSAEKSEPECEEEPSKFEKWLADKFGDKLMTVLMSLSAVLALCLALGLFVVIPTLVAKFIGNFAELGGWLTVIESLVKIVMFVLYIVLISRMQEIRRVFEYHGAEHKSIFCYEAGLELNVENVRKQSRFHPRCGTSFLLIVLVISILIFSLPIVPWDNVLVRIGLKILLLPVVVGISYEIIKFAGRHDNLFTKIISAPGLWFQRLTTKEPDDSQIEVAIASLNAVLPKDKEEAKW